MQNINNSIIFGNVAGRDYNTLVEIKELFNITLFLHFLGDKISHLISQNFNKEYSIYNTKILVLLFDDLLISLSDIIQSDYIYKSKFFRSILSLDCIHVIGTRDSEDYESFFANREEDYKSPGFYNIISKHDFLEFVDIIKKHTIPKTFSTTDKISYSWTSTLSSINNKGIDSIDNVPLKYFYYSNTDLFSSQSINRIIQIPEKLNGFPFIWDSVEKLDLISKHISPTSINNIEKYLAQNWIESYLENYNAFIPNKLLPSLNSSFGLKQTFDFDLVLSFLKNFNLLNLIINLSFEELIITRSDKSLGILKEIINKAYNQLLCFKKPTKVYDTINRINEKDWTAPQKIKEIVLTIYDRCIK